MTIRRSSFTTRFPVLQGRRWAALGLALLLLAPGAWAQEGEPFTINGQRVEAYLAEKYDTNLRRTHNVRSTLQQTPHGPSGYVYLNSLTKPITPKGVVITEDSIHGRARAVAEAFLQEEAELLGITHMEEIREVKIRTGTGRRGDYTIVYYGRYINDLELEHMSIQMTVGQDEKITSVSADLVPAPPELYAAVTRPTLTESDIRKIVLADLAADAASPETDPIARARIRRDSPHYPDPEQMELRKHLIGSSPYVVWHVKAVWAYTVDAFTGKILTKAPTWIVG